MLEAVLPPPSGRIKVQGFAVQEFTDKGFAVIPGLLSGQEVAELRETCVRFLTDTGMQELLPAEFLSTPGLASVPFRAQVADLLKDVLGPSPCVYPNLTVRKNLYVSWHVDEAFIGPGRQYVWLPTFRHVQAAVYLQDNDDDLGGGLDVVPGTHRMSFDGYGLTEPDYEVILRHVLTAHDTHRIKSRAGDLVLWDARLLHASTPSNASAAEESGRPKFGVFFSAGSGDPYAANRYLSHLVSKRIQLNDGVPVFHPRHAAVLDVRFPADYPEWLQRRMKEIGLSVASF